MPYTPIVGTLGYVLSPNQQEVLLIHRVGRADDYHLGKYNGLGGKLDPREDIVTGMQREIYEEAGITATGLQLRGTVSWPGFGKNGEDWFGFVFLITAFKGEVIPDCAEGKLVWKKREELETLPMWEGDRYFLPMVFDADPRCFHGVMPYQNGKPIGWHYQRI